MKRIHTMYTAMAACSSAGGDFTATVLDGENFGEKAFFSGGELLWQNQENGYFSRNREEILAAAKEPARMKKGLAVLGGTRVFFDFLGQEAELVICGAGHVSMPLIQIGKMMGCQVTVLEDRLMFADNARRAGADRVICDSFEDGLRQVEGTENTYFIIVTRGHRYDQVCLEKIVEKKHAYIGMIGSRKRVAAVKDYVLNQGGDPVVLDRVYTPIGLDIGAETPVEIGVAIMAEIIEVKNRVMRSCGYSKDMLRALMENAEKESGPDRVLCTIVARKGSAPRDAGAKLLVFADGRCAGTIGGGCMEAAVIGKALHMIRSKGPEARLEHVDMTGEDAEEEGMVCGGMVDVLLELI